MASKKKQALDEYEVLHEKILRGVFHPKQRLVEAELAEKQRLTALIREMKQALESGNPVTVGRGSRAIRAEMWRISGHQTISQLLEMLNTKQWSSGRAMTT